MNSSGLYRYNYGMINNNAAFAALDEYGRVYAWGKNTYGGITEDGSYVTVETEHGIKDLSNIVQIYSTEAAFAALDSSGNVYAWGDQAYGGFNTVKTKASANIL